MSLSTAISVASRERSFRANKVPQVTIFFWIIKILCTTIGETAADFLNGSLHLGLSGTSVVMAVLLVIILVFQFRADRYIPAIYWLVVVVISVVGTLITDNLSDNLGVPLTVSTAVFSVALAITFIVWHHYEHTLSIHQINTHRREAFYWLSILFTFALGTATGDLIAEKLQLGYLLAGGIFAGLILLTFLAYSFFRLNAVAAFWIAYILTRPLGASIGDLLTQDPKDGGLGFGIRIVNAVFFVAIIVIVIYLTRSKKDVVRHSPAS